jgi:DNA-binding NtrC family response regulator
MPGMRGTALAPKIIQIHPEAKVIWMSGYPGDVLDDLPNASFMQKPVDLRLLVARIQNLLNLS